MRTHLPAFITAVLRLAHLIAAEKLAMLLNPLATSSVLHGLLTRHGKTLLGMTSAAVTSTTLRLELRRSGTAAVTMTATPHHHLRHRKSNAFAVAVTAATAATHLRHSERSAAASMSAAVATSATALLLNRRGITAAAVRISTAATTTVAAAGLRVSRPCNRQCGDARSQKQPAHEISPLERAKRSVRCTVPTPKRLELAG
jgi:hypothetical protein